MRHSHREDESQQTSNIDGDYISVAERSTFTSVTREGGLGEEQYSGEPCVFCLKERARTIDELDRWFSASRKSTRKRSFVCRGGLCWSSGG